MMVPVPTLSGPTSGRVIEEELEEWARQARRWTIGAAEVFHYFMVKSTNIPFLTALSWGITFIIYYGNNLSMHFLKCQESDLYDRKTEKKRGRFRKQEANANIWLIPHGRFVS